MIGDGRVAVCPHPDLRGSVPRIRIIQIAVSNEAKGEGQVSPVQVGVHRLAAVRIRQRSVAVRVVDVRIGAEHGGSDGGHERIAPDAEARRQRRRLRDIL